MYVSGREAAAILAEAGLTRERSRRLLHAGFAGEGLRTRGALLYDEALVYALLERPVVDMGRFSASCPDGAFVLRAWRGIRVGAPLEAQVAELRMRWWLSPWARLHMRIAMELRGHFPFLVTVSGFVAVGADLVGLRLERGPERIETRLVVKGPGGWYDDLRGCRLDTGAGGPWVLWSHGREPQGDPCRWSGTGAE